MSSIAGRALFLILTMSFFAGRAEAVTEVWRRAAASSTAGYDEGRCVALDGSGNVYSAGVRSASSFQYVLPQQEAYIVKYSLSGEKLWSFGYNPLRDAAPGEGNTPANAEAVAIELNAAGEVVTAINSVGPDGRYDGVILKLDANGQLLRERRLNQPGQRIAGIARMIVRPDGGLYLLGSNPEVVSGVQPILARVNPDGVVMWRTALTADEGTNSPVAIGADAAGAVYVASRLQLNQGGPDIRVQRINSDGTSAWIQTFRGDTFDTEELADIAVDADGNSVVCGHILSTTTFKERVHLRRYNSAGDLLWSDTFNASATSDNSRAVAVKLDAGGNILVAGFAENGIGAGKDIVAAKYSAAGARLWSSAYNSGLNVADTSDALAVSGSGNPTVLGQSGVPGFTSSVAVQFDAADGHQVWLSQPGGTPPYTVNAPGIVAMDGAGRVALSVSLGTGSVGSADMLTALIDNSGAKLWSNVESLERSIATPRGVTVLADGSAWVYGDGETLRYNAAGQSLPISGNVLPGSYSNVAVLSDGAGGVFALSGTIRSVVNRTMDFGLIHYASDGSVLSQTIHERLGIDDSPRSMAIDGAGMVVAAGTSRSGFGESDVFVVKFDPTGFGSVVWTAGYNSPTSLSERVVGVGVDASANVYVGGDEVGANGRRNFFVLKLNSAGTQQWVYRYDAPDPFYSDDQAVGFSVDSAGNCTLAGTLVRSNGKSAVSVIRVNASGALQWATEHSPDISSHLVIALLVDADGNCSVGAERFYFDNTGAVPPEARMEIVRLNAAGVVQWVADLGAPRAFPSQFPMRLAGGSSGVMYAVSYDVLANGSDSPLVARLNSAGGIDWQIHVPQPDGSSSFPVDIAAAADSSLRVIACIGPAGSFENPQGALTIRLDQTSGAPVVVTLSASTSKWTALVNPNGSETSVSFEYGAGAFTDVTPAFNVPSGSDQVVEFTPVGLAPHTTYFVRAVATNTSATSRSELKTLITPNQAPVTQVDEVESDGSAVSILPLANDSDPDGDPLQAFAFSTVYSEGVLSQNGNTLTFTPAAGFEGDFRSGCLVTDGYSVPVNVEFTVRVRRASPAALAIASKRGTGDPVPGAPAGTKFFSFGQPTIHGINASFRATTILGTVKSEAIFSGSPLVRRVGSGDPAPGAGSAVFATVGEPVYIIPAVYGFAGKLKGADVTTKNDTGIWADYTTGLVLVAREGDEAPGTGGAAFDSFLGMEGVSGGFYIYAKLRTKGAAKVTAANDFGVWFHNSFSLSPVLREGDPVTLPGPIIRNVTKIEALMPVKGTSSERRVSSFGSPARLSARISLSDKTQAIASLIPNAAPILHARLGVADSVGRIPLKLGIPDAFQTGIASLVNWKVATGIVTSKDDSAVVVHQPGGAGAVIVVAREGAPAPGIAGAKFSSFGDPIGARQVPIYENHVVFRATASGPGLTPANNTGIWRFAVQAVGGNPLSAAVLIARKGAEAPGTNGAKFASFDSMATMDENEFSVLFTGKLAGRGVNATNNFGLWAAEMGPMPKLVLRTGQQVTVGASTKTVSLFSVLGPVLGTPTQHRASESGGRRVAVRASFTDRTEAVLTVRIP